MTRRLAASIALLLWAAPSCGQEDPTGIYKGAWSGMSAQGEFTLELTRSADQWKAAVRFTLGDAEVPTAIQQLEVREPAIETSYEFELGGVKLQSHLKGEIRSGRARGTYKTKAVADDSTVDEGTWEAARQRS